MRHVLISSLKIGKLMRRPANVTFTCLFDCTFHEKFANIDCFRRHSQTRLKRRLSPLQNTTSGRFFVKNRRHRKAFPSRNPYALKFLKIYSTGFRRFRNVNTKISRKVIKKSFILNILNHL